MADSQIDTSIYRDAVSENPLDAAGRVVEYRNKKGGRPFLLRSASSLGKSYSGAPAILQGWEFDAGLFKGGSVALQRAS